MILKKLEIQGFKSFPDRTEIVFSPGVIAVVGPNGSGKSNISDALLWVLGENNVRAIRGQKYQDVIFSGTDKRRAVGMAEVSLTIDNADGKLPIDYSEVTITRRAFRSGESEFMINKSPCRLKDIYELFLDTGIGRQAYSIVSQGEIDAILSVRPEDRRALFDEAAGIRKYRHRKKEAERKLNATEQNLLRVNDIISEIETQIEPMSEQAEIAKRYLELVARLQEIEVGILVNDLQRHTTEIQNVREQKETYAQEIVEAEDLLSALDEEKSALAIDLASADSQVEKFNSLYQEVSTHAERTESQLALVNQRHSASVAAEKLLVEEIVQLEGRLSQLELQRTDVSTGRGAAEQEEADLNCKIVEKTAELEKIHQQINEASQAANDQKSNYIELAKQLAAQRNEFTNSVARIESLRTLIERRASELKDAELESEKSNAELQSAKKDLEKVKADVIKVAKEMAELRDELAKNQVRVKESADNLMQLNRTIVDKRSRLTTLKEMEEAREGYFAGVRSVMTDAKKGKLAGNFKVVADVIKVPAGYETAYEVALGASLQDIITDTEKEAKAAIEYLKTNKSGRATFLPLNMMRHTVSPSLKDLAGKNGVVGLGNELVEFDPKYASAVDALLAKVVVTQNIDSAIAVSKSAIGWSKIVTLAGEIIFPSGAITGGHSVGKTVNILGRKQEIESLQSQVKQLEKQIDDIEKGLASLQKEADENSVKLREIEDEDTRLKMSLLEKERQLDYAGRESKRLTQEKEDLHVEKENLQDELRQAVEVRDKLFAAIENADKENANLDGAMSQSEEQVRKLQSEYDSVSAEVNAMNVAMASLTQKKLSMEQSLENAAATVREISTEIYRKKSQIENAKQEKVDTERRNVELEAELEKVRLQVEETHAQAEQWRKTKQTILNSSAEVSGKIKDISDKREDTRQKLHAAELRETRLDMQISQAVARLLEEYDVTAEDALSREKPEVKHGSATEVMRLRREIRHMGEVNTGAVQEYERLTERFEFLDGQRGDLLEARQKLLDAIREIDESTRGVFIETFEAVGKAFEIMFVRLFNGGSTELVLTDPDDILETGIDVIVELPGKKRQNLLLLSGGERALTAAALMFALMAVRPSPFCLLDEVDAPLDEANIEKFADVIKEFAEESQMIVITHNKSTMEAADVLYGVTMQEPGVSKIVSVKLTEMASRN